MKVKDLKTWLDASNWKKTTESIYIKKYDKYMLIMTLTQYQIVLERETNIGDRQFIKVVPYNRLTLSAPMASGVLFSRNPQNPMEMWRYVAC